MEGVYLPLRNQPRGLVMDSGFTQDGLYVFPLSVMRFFAVCSVVSHITDLLHVLNDECFGFFSF